MDERAHPIKPRGETPTPEVAHLLTVLDLEAAARRARRSSPSSLLQTPTFRYGSILAIVVFSLGSLGLLEWFLSQMPKPVRSMGSVPAGLSAPAGAAIGGPSVLAAWNFSYRN